MENLSDHLFMFFFIVSAREEAVWKDAVCKGRNGGKVVYFPPESAYFLCNYYD